MKKKIINRRQFLKTVGYIFAGTALSQTGRLFGLTKNMTNKKAGMREAKYYSDGNHLAG